MNNKELWNTLSDEDIKRSLLYSQLLILFIAVIFSLFLFEHPFDWLNLMAWDFSSILLLGLLPGLAIVCIDFLFMKILPERFMDDGGINKRVFKSLTFYEIIILVLLIAVAEEALFRGVIQTTFGYIFASSLFVIVHVRYLKKPVLMISIIFVSFLIGYIFELTSNLLVTITTHFVVDFILGIYIRYRG